jgi:hypothetical protein
MLEQVSEVIVPDVPEVPMITQIHVSHIESKAVYEEKADSIPRFETCRTYEYMQHI